MSQRDFHHHWVGHSLLSADPLRASANEFFLILYFFSIYQKYMSCFFIFKNVTQPPVHPAEGCYRRMNRR